MFSALSPRPQKFLSVSANPPSCTPTGSPLQSATPVPTPKPFYCSFHTINNLEAERRTVINSWDPASWSGQRRGLCGGVEMGAGVCAGGGIAPAFVSWQKLSACSFRLRYCTFNLGCFLFFLKTAHTFRVSRMPHTPRVNLSVPCAQSLPPFRTLLLYRAGGTEAAVAHDKSQAWNSIRKGSAQDFTAFTEENSFWYIGTPIYSIALISKHPTSGPPFLFLSPSLFISLSIFLFLVLSEIWLSNDRNLILSYWFVFIPLIVIWHKVHNSTFVTLWKWLLQLFFWTTTLTLLTQGITTSPKLFV